MGEGIDEGHTPKENLAKLNTIQRTKSIAGIRKDSKEELLIEDEEIKEDNEKKMKVKQRFNILSHGISVLLINDLNNQLYPMMEVTLSDFSYESNLDQGSYNGETSFTI